VLGNGVAPGSGGAFSIMNCTLYNTNASTSSNTYIFLNGGTTLISSGNTFYSTNIGLTTFNPFGFKVTKVNNIVRYTNSAYISGNVAGTNIWTITVQYASFPIPPIEPLVQSYKFVNNDWGTNEGLDPNNTIVSGGCGALDGTDTNRKLTISTLAADTVLNYCWDQCLPCSAAGFQLVNNQSNFSLFPLVWYKHT
jgi:hypothetical protein